MLTEDLVNTIRTNWFGSPDLMTDTVINAWKLLDEHMPPLGWNVKLVESDVLCVPTYYDDVLNPPFIEAVVTEVAGFYISKFLACLPDDMYGEEVDYYTYECIGVLSIKPLLTAWGV